MYVGYSTQIDNIITFLPIIVASCYLIFATTSIIETRKVKRAFRRICCYFGVHTPDYEQNWVPIMDSNCPHYLAHCRYCGKPLFNCIKRNDVGQLTNKLEDKIWSTVPPCFRQVNLKHKDELPPHLSKGGVFTKDGFVKKE